MKKKKIITINIVIAIIIVVIAGACIGYFYGFMYPYRGSVKNFERSLALDSTITKAEATEDLNYLYDKLTSRHPMWLEDNPRKREVENRYNESIKSLNNNVSILEFLKISKSITSQLNDGHTWVGWSNPAESLYINDLTQLKEYGRPVSIDGISINEIFDRFKALSSYELEFYIEAQFFNKYIVSEESLRLCDIDTSDGVIMEFNTPSGKESFNYTFVVIEEVIGYEANEEENAEWVYYTIDKEKDLAVFTLDQCIYNDYYKEVLDAFFNEVSKNNISNIAVDLRNNGGGNSKVANEFIRYLDVDSYKSWDNDVRFAWYMKKNRNFVHKNKIKEPTFNGNIFVLTGTYTFSSAMDFAMLIKDNNIGKLVGSASGNMPSSYGDCIYFQMPNSKLAISVSFKKWYRIDKSKLDEPLTPDYEVPSKDALEKVYDLIES